MAFIPEAEFWWEAELAKTSRAACKKCKEKITQGEPRLAWTTHEEDHWGSTWGNFHPACAVTAAKFWKNLKPVDVNNIKGLDSLPEDAKAAIRAAVQGGSAAGKAAAKATPKAAAKATAKASAKAAAKAEAAGESVVPRKRPAAAGDLAEAPAAKKRAKAKAAPAPADPAAAGPPAEVVAELQKLSADKLKALLRLNEQNVTGTKGELVSRAADGKAFGALPRCPKCFGGRIRYEAKVYRCPGYMDDDHFRKCDFAAETIERLPWKDA